MLKTANATVVSFPNFLSLKTSSLSTRLFAKKRNLQPKKKFYSPKAKNYSHLQPRKFGKMSKQDRDEVLQQYQQKWMKEQFDLKQKLITTDDFDFLLPSQQRLVDQNNYDTSNNSYSMDEKQTEENNENGFKKLKYVAGVDVSHASSDLDEDLACAGVVILEYPSLKEVYRKFVIVRYTQPYIAGFLAFREVSFLVDILNEIKEYKPQYIPQIIFVDGNGVLHHRGFGLASHLGVLTNIPTIGIGKNLLHIDGLKWKNGYKEICLRECNKAGDYVDLIGNSGKCHGVALRCGTKGHNCIFVSIGHRICLNSCIELVMACSKHKIPEPIRAADLNTRDTIRNYEQKMTQDREKKKQKEKIVASS